ncbi:MAG: putative sugar nucleotidyl transferase [Chitinophagaceae bacterium]
MSIILFDNSERKKLYPLTITRSVADLRMGIFTQTERWQSVSKDEVFVVTENYLQHLYKSFPEKNNLWIDASLIADDNLTAKILSLEDGSAIADEKEFIAGKISVNKADDFLKSPLQYFKKIDNIQNAKRLEYCWQIFQWNDEMIRKDFFIITKNRTSQKISSTNKIIPSGNIFMEEGAQVEHSILNASTGPIYIGKNATIMEGCFIRGPFALGENGLLKMGTKIYGATTLGKFCIGGGEIKNAVMQACSNKAHDGYLGDSVIGWWCNLGAGTSNSNIKNTAGDVKLFDNHSNELVTVGNKCGVLMGDYSRTAINSSINTGTVIGVCCNVFGEGLLPTFISNFTWGTKGLTKYEFDKALRDIDNWKKLKNQNLTEAETKILKHIFEKSL